MVLIKRGRLSRWIAAISSLAIGLTGTAAAVVGGSSPASAATTANVPYQLVTKAFSEVLGRLPSNTEWDTWAKTYWANQGYNCTAPTVVGFIQQFSGAAANELATHNYTPQQLTIVAYRFVLNEDPPARSFTSSVAVVTGAGGGRAGFTALINNLMNTTAFQSLLAYQICSANAGYSFGSNPAIDPNNPAGGYAVGNDTAELQSWLNAAAGTSNLVTLPAGTVYGITAPLNVPSGVTIETTGTPAPTDYLAMARIVKLPGFPNSGDDAMFRVTGSARLDYLWVDGQSPVANIAYDVTNGQDAELRNNSGDTTTLSGWIVDDRLDGSDRVATTAWVAGDGLPQDVAGCSSAQVSLNLITGYTSVHAAPWGRLQDGIQLWCGSATAYANEIVDETDAPIVLFGANGGDQASLVEYNLIESAGNSAFYGIVLDPGFAVWGTPGYACSTNGSVYADEGGFNPNLGAWHKVYAGTTVQDNVLWTGARTWMDVVLSIGSHELQGSCEHPVGPGSNPYGGLNGNGETSRVTVTANQSQNELTNAQIGIYVGGMFNATVTNTNAFPAIVFPGGGCPIHQAFVVVAGNGTYPNYAAGLSTTLPYTNDSTGADDHCNLGF